MARRGRSFRWSLGGTGSARRIPGVVGSVITLGLVNLFPARRTRDILGLVTVITAGGLVLFARLAAGAAGPAGRLSDPRRFHRGAAHTIASTAAERVGAA